jgi:hypothetical protein
MGLKISNLATDKQKAFLEKLGYSGRGQYALSALSFDEASDLIEELLEEQRLMERDEGDEYSWD